MAWRSRLSSRSVFASIFTACQFNRKIPTVRLSLVIIPGQIELSTWWGLVTCPNTCAANAGDQWVVFTSLHIEQGANHDEGRHNAACVRTALGSFEYGNGRVGPFRRTSREVLRNGATKRHWQAGCFMPMLPLSSPFCYGCLFECVE